MITGNRRRVFFIRIVSVLSLATILPVIFTGLIVSQQGQRFFAESYNQQLELSLSRASEAIDLFLGPLDRSVRDLSGDRDVVNTVLLGLEDNAGNVRGAVAAMNRLTTTFDGVLSSYLYLSRHGEILTSDGNRTTINQFYDRSWLGDIDRFFLGARKTPARLIRDSRGNSFRVFSFIRSVPYGTWDTDGYLVVNVLESSLSRFLMDQTDTGASMFILDEEGAVVSHRDSVFLGRSIGELRATIESHRVVGVRPLTLSPWSLVMVVSNNSMKAQIFRLYRLVASLSVAWVIVGLVVAYVLAARLYSPVSHLVKVFFDEPGFPHVAGDEIHLVEDAYNDLKNEMLKTEEQLATLKPNLEQFIVERCLAGRCDEAKIARSTVGPMEPARDDPWVVIVGSELKYHPGGFWIEYPDNCVVGVIPQSLIGPITDGHVPVGMSEICERLEGLHLSLDQARVAFGWALFAGLQRALSFQATKITRRDDLIAINQEIDEIVDIVASGNKSSDLAARTAVGALSSYAVKIGPEDFRSAILRLAGRLVFSQPEVSDVTAVVNARESMLLGIVESKTAAGMLLSVMDFISTLSDASEIPESKILNRHVRIMREFVEENYSSDIGLSDAAEEAGLSVPYASTLFKKETGESFVDFVARFRVEQAVSILSSREVSISDLAEACGFLSVQSFIRTFKRYMGTTPGRYNLHGDHDA